MTSINFDEPSTGEVNVDDKSGLAVTNSGMLGIGIFGESTNDSSGQGVMGKSRTEAGVHGESTTGPGVFALSSDSIGLIAKGKDLGIQAVSTGSEVSTGVQGSTQGVEGAGIQGQATNPNGHAVGVLGLSESWYGVFGKSQKTDGVRGETNSMSGSGVAGVHTGGGIGVWGQGKVAGHFEGDVEITRNMNIKGDMEVTGDIKLLNPQHADCAEDFDIVEENVESGTVMVLTEKGSLQSSHQEYDKKVVGIVSGAGGFKPAFVLNRQSQSKNECKNTKDENKNNQRLPIALMGKVFCKVDARHSPIEIGDLLSTSSTKGYAMKADDLTKAFGAILGKALGSFKGGLGMIPVLVTLQ